jgi:hypothetical protein
MGLGREVYSVSIWFILHSLTITTALTWSDVINRLISSYNKNLVKYHFVYAIVLTILSVFLHITLSKYAKKPDDETEDIDKAVEGVMASSSKKN